MSEHKETLPGTADHITGGAEKANERGRIVITLPFDPETVTVEDLPDRLEEVSDERLLHRMQELDTRITAAGSYERRLNDLRGKPTPSKASKRRE